MCLFVAVCVCVCVYARSSRCLVGRLKPPYGFTLRLEDGNNLINIGAATRGGNILYLIPTLLQ